MITDPQYYEIFETIARNHKKIAHSATKLRFFKNPDEVPDKELAPEFYLILLAPEYEYLDQNSDNLIERLKGTFLIIKPVDRENYTAELNTINDARIIARQILSRLKKLRSEKVFNEFTIGSSRGSTIGPILENCHGVAYTFTIGDGAGITYDPLNWLDS